MNNKDISEAKDPDIRSSMVALQRASLLARQTAIRTGTRLIIVKDGQLLRLTSEEILKSSESSEVIIKP